jgi:hypothetical protein
MRGGCGVVRLPHWVRIDKTHSEHNESGHPPIADIGPTSISVVKGQTRTSMRPPLVFQCQGVTPHFGLHLEPHEAHMADGRVPAFDIVEAFDVVEHVSPASSRAR